MNFQTTSALDLSHGTTFTYISTGSNGLDSLLNGGVRCGEIIEISGKSGSGKTQLAMALAIQCDGPTCVIDTSHGISPERLAEMATSSTASHATEDTSVQNSLSTVHVSNVHDLFQLYDKLENISPTTKLLIIDCISIFIASEFCYPGYAGQAAVENVSKMLRFIARTYNTAIVVTNGVVSNRNAKKGQSTTKPALGRAWSFIPDRRLMLSSEDHYQAPTRVSRADCTCSIGVIDQGVCLRGGDGA